MTERTYFTCSEQRLTCCCSDWWLWASACRPSPPAKTPACWSAGTARLSSSSCPSVKDTQDVQAKSACRQSSGRAAHLRRKLSQEIVIGGEGSDGNPLADGGGQGFDFVKTAVQLVYSCQPGGWRMEESFKEPLWSSFKAFPVVFYVRLCRF